RCRRRGGGGACRWTWNADLLVDPERIAIEERRKSQGACREGVMRTKDEERWFEAERIAYEAKYLAAADPRGQSGFGRDECDWIRFRRPIAAAINKDGTFLDIGCANGLLMESLVRWAGEAGHVLEPYGIDISEKLAGLARQRLPQWSDRISVGNALYWNPHHQ